MRRVPGKWEGAGSDYSQETAAHQLQSNSDSARGGGSAVKIRVFHYKNKLFINFSRTCFSYILKEKSHQR